jgi:hypothetical protein
MGISPAIPEQHGIQHITGESSLFKLGREPERTIEESALCPRQTSNKQFV